VPLAIVQSSLGFDFELLLWVGERDLQVAVFQRQHEIVILFGANGLKENS
jgi:hypothetical protein